MNGTAFEALRFSGGPEAVPRARLAAATFLSRRAPELADDTTLVVSELVTNSLLHGVMPGTLRLALLVDAVRVEVEDGGHDVPRRSDFGDQAATGRGLGLVAALSRAWGVEPRPEGKVVWAEIDGTIRTPSAAPDLDIDALLDAWSDDALEPTFTVDLGEVPTALLLEAKAHVDNLVRELTLAAAGAEAGAARLPDHIVGLLDGVVHRFATTRAAVKQAALSAAARGEPVTRLVLTLPASAVDASEEYLDALDRADRYACAARLLTLATPPTHRVFRRWYVEALTGELRARAAGTSGPPFPTFEQRLIEEFDRMALAQAQTSRLARLQAVTAALAETTTAEEAIRVLLDEGVKLLGASGGSVFLVSEDAVMVPATVGFSDELVLRLAAEQPGDNLPATTAARTGRPVWVESPEDRNSTFPDFTELEPTTAAVCAVPLRAGPRVFGAIRFSFSESHLFDDEERRFVEALAAQATAALQRSELYAAEREARREAEQLAAVLSETAERLRLLQTVTAQLTAAQDVDAVGQIVVRNATVGIGADSAALFLFDPEHDELVLQAAGGAAGTLVNRHKVSLGEQLPATEALRRGEMVAIDQVGAHLERFPGLADRYPPGMSLLVAPLLVGDHRLGVLRLGFRQDRHIDRRTQESFLAALADACAQALERAAATAKAEETARHLALLAAASAVLSNGLDTLDPLTEVVELLVPHLADWCVVELSSDAVLRPVAVAGPARLVTDARRVLQPVVIDPRPDRQLDRWLRRTGGVLLGDVAGAAHTPPAAATSLGPAAPTRPQAVPERYLRLLRQHAASALAVPLTGRTGTIGTVLLGRHGPADGRPARRYGSADLTLAEDLARRIALAVEAATAFQEQRGRLVAVTRVAEAAQQAILAPPPPRLGPVDLAARYLSAAAEAQIGGDLFEVVARPGSVRLLVGDVRGKGLDAVRKATIVLGEFRSAAAGYSDLATVARQLDARVTPYLGDEDFVTAVLADISNGGELRVACCGHPPALLVGAAGTREVGRSGSLPLGLGAAPTVVGTSLEPGDRLLLYTDGLIEARDRHGRFVALDDMLRALAVGTLDQALDQLLAKLTAAVGDDLGDDLALLLACYQPG